MRPCSPQRSLFATNALQILFIKSLGVIFRGCCSSCGLWNLECTNIVDRRTRRFLLQFYSHFMLPDDDENSLSLLLGWSLWPNWSILDFL